MGTVQTNHKKAAREQLLHLSPNVLIWLELAHRASLGQSITGSLSQIRSQGTKASVLQLQYKSRGDGGRLLQENATGNRTRKDVRTRSGQAKKRKGLRSLRKLDW